MFSLLTFLIIVCLDKNLIVKMFRVFFSSAAPKTPKIDTDEFDGKIQQLITMGISEVRVKTIALPSCYM